MAIQQRAVLTRARVLTAAAEVFARTGFLAASMNDIVDQAGVTKGAVYFHFPSKEALAVAIVEEQFQQWPPVVESLVKHSPNAMVSIVALTYEVGSRFRDDVLVTAGVRLSFERGLVNADMPTPFVGWISQLQMMFTQARREGLLRPGRDADAGCPSAGRRLLRGPARFGDAYQPAGPGNPIGRILANLPGRRSGRIGLAGDAASGAEGTRHNAPGNRSG